MDTYQTYYRYLTELGLKMFTVEFHSERVRVKEGVSAKNQKPYRIREQQAFVYLNGEPYPQKMTVTLGDSQQPFAPGSYDMTPEFYVGGFGDLRIGMRDAIFEPVKDAKKATA